MTCAPFQRDPADQNLIGSVIGECNDLVPWRVESHGARGNSLIEVTPRGPSIAGTRITVYSIMDYIKADWGKEEILQVMRITPEQLDAVYDLDNHFGVGRIFVP